MALKTFTMSFKEKNPEEVKLHEILSLKTSPMAFAKDILIEVLIRGKTVEFRKDTEENSEINEILDI